MPQCFHGNYVVSVVGEKHESLSRVPYELLWDEFTYLASFWAKPVGLSRITQLRTYKEIVAMCNLVATPILAFEHVYKFKNKSLLFVSQYLMF